MRKGFEEKKIRVKIFVKTLSLVVNYPTTNAKRPISNVYLQLLCEIAGTTYIKLYVSPTFFPLRSLVFMGLQQILWTKIVNENPESR